MSERSWVRAPQGTARWSGVVRLSNIVHIRKSKEHPPFSQHQYDHQALLAQLVERTAFNRMVVGSSPTEGKRV